MHSHLHRCIATVEGAFAAELRQLQHRTTRRRGEDMKYGTVEHDGHISAVLSYMFKKKSLAKKMIIESFITVKSLV
jgi:hypothetical protein